MWKKLKNFVLDLFFPRFCLNCQKEGDYLCEDCKAMLQISGFHQTYSTGNLKDLYFALDYGNPLIKNLIKKFKDEPFVKELAKTLSDLIISHFQLMDNKPDFSDFVLVAVPLEKKKLKWRGFNPAEELAKELSLFFKIPLINDVLVKIKETFSIKNTDLIKDKNILLIDDVYTVNSLFEECGRILKKFGAKEIIVIVATRG